MDDISEKLRGILSDEESLRQISELAQMFTGGSFSPQGEATDNAAAGGGADASAASPQGAASSQGIDLGGLFGGMGGIDPSLIMKISSLAANASSDNSTQLLAALRPLIREERREKLDKAVKLLKLLAIYTAAKDSGLLDNLGSLL